MKFKFVNEIPKDLEPGKTYNTRVVEAKFEDGDLVIELEFLGTQYEDHSCLFPLTKESTDGTGKD